MTGRPVAASCSEAVVDVEADGAGCSLADLAPGARVMVVGVVAGGCEATVRRLLHLGFTPGTVVDVVRQAPLRDPVVYRVKDYDICLRRAQAACIQTARLRAAEVSR